MFRKITLSKLQQNGNYFFQNGGKKLLLISLVLFQTTTYAAWEKLMTIENTTVYVDMSQGQSTQEVVTVYELRDCGEQREFMGSMYGFSFRSSQFLTEYKCSKREMRRLESTWFADQMGNGKISFKKMNPQDWTSADDDPVNKALVDHFCSAK